MKTLYDLLEALPDDDAEGLRAAFRKAAKANHPDFNPGNPEASERFRRIVRANAILSDGQQRAAYDRLLEIAKRQQSPQPKRGSPSSIIRRLAADAIASAVVSVVLIGSYFAYISAGRLPLASAQVVEIAKGEPAQAIPVKPAEISDAHRHAEQSVRPESIEALNIQPDVNPRAADEPAKPDNTAAAVTTGDQPLRSTLLLAGVPVHVVAARLGHADPAVTLRIYSHVLREHTLGVGDVFAQAVSASVSKSVSNPDEQR